MAITLLAVDDSVTMRKVLEITFAGPDFRVVTANSPDVALQKLKTDKPDLVISDITLEPKSGYELCKAIKQLAPGTPVLLLSSKQSQFDAVKGSQAQADDHMDKPFDTQQMIDKVKKMLQARGEAKQQAGAAAASGITAPGPRPVLPATGPAAIPSATPTSAVTTPQRQKTLIYTPGGGPAPGPAPGGAVRPTTAVTPAGKPGPMPTSPTPSAGLPRQRPSGPMDRPEMRPAAPQATAMAATAGATAAQVNGQMAEKLEGLGLTPTQVDAVLALSREVVERVVWEVVPVLAETIIKEEIARLTK
ncbi:MAG: response regulator [Polyangiaceae bacterium]|nr:response regulator [Polyangiaceae bacterium]